MRGTWLLDCNQIPSFSHFWNTLWLIQISNWTTYIYRQTNFHQTNALIIIFILKLTAQNVTLQKELMANWKKKDEEKNKQKKLCVLPNCNYQMIILHGYPISILSIVRRISILSTIEFNSKNCHLQNDIIIVIIRWDIN